MNSPSAERLRDTVAPQLEGPGGAGRQDLRALDEGCPLIRAARTFAMRAHARQRRESDGAPFIEHPLDVARLLRAAGCSDVVVAAGLLHDVLEDTTVTDEELAARFGAEVAVLVRAVSDDPRIGDYRERKQRLREQVRAIGGDAAVVFAADKICKVRELDAAPARGPAEGARGPSRREQARRLRMEHYDESLAMLRRVAAHHPLVHDLADALAAAR